MDEALISEQLKANIPRESTVVAPVASAPTQDISEGISTPNAVDEITMYKLLDLMGVDMKEADTQSKSQAEYIYMKIAEIIGSTDYMVIANKIREYERILGIQYAQDKLFRLYKWIKLDGMRKSIEQEMMYVSQG
jgi:hypothetical protein